MPAEREDFPIARVASLARLELSGAEATLYHAQLAQIVAFVSQVTAAAFDTPPAESGLAPDGAGGERPDEVRMSLPADAALANAPDATVAPRLVRVPKVIG